MRIHIIAGARPNFIKISPIIDQIKKSNQYNQKIEYKLIHTGQHYDQNMSHSFFTQLGIPSPDFNLNCGGGSHAEQTGKIMIKYESLLKSEKVDLCLVVGDVNSTMACAIVAKKNGLKVIHIEAGIRSFDQKMPEEINRIVTDSISDYLFTTSEFANQNLIKEGKNKENIFFVGNTMIDTLKKYDNKFQKPSIWNEIKLRKRNYIVLTTHRPSNVDNEKKLNQLINTIMENSRGFPVIFPVHPRTKLKLKKINKIIKNLFCINPLSYLEFNYLVKNSIAVITDSGGITEETTIMNIPCLTLRENTERPETVFSGTNKLIGNDPVALKSAMKLLFEGEWKKSEKIPLWDGKTSSRIIKYMIDIYKQTL